MNVFLRFPDVYVQPVLLPLFRLLMAPSKLGRMRLRASSRSMRNYGCWMNSSSASGARTILV